MSRTLPKTLLLTFLAVPSVASAETELIDTIRGLVVRLGDVVNIIAFFAVGLAVFIIIVGIFRYLSAGGDEGKRREAVPFVTWGIISVFIMLSVWGFVNILRTTFPLEQGNLGSKEFFEQNKIVLPETSREVRVDTSIGHNATEGRILSRSRPTNFVEFVNYVIEDVNTLIGLIVVLAGGAVAGVIVTYIGAGGNREKMLTGQKLIFLGIIGLFVMLSFWGIAFMIKESLLGTF